MLPLIVWIAYAEAAQAVLEVDSAEVQEGQGLTLRLSVVDAQVRGVPSVAVPDGLQVQYQGQSQQHSVINFQTTTVTTFRYALMALKKGSYTIGPVTVESSAGSLIAPALRLNVVDRQSQDGMDQLKADLSGLSSAVAWVGQTLIYHLRFQTARSLVSGRWSLPDLSGFSPEPGVEPKTLEYPLAQDGNKFSVQELFYAIRASQDGAQSLPGGVLQAQFAVSRRRNQAPGRIDPLFDLGAFSDVRTEVFAADPLKLTVKALPTGRPTDFSGLVGQFTVEASASDTSLETGETVTLLVRVQGDGALAGFSLPPLTLDGLRVYDDQPVVETVINQGRLESTATFKRALVPEKPGNISIPPTQFSYFDPVAGQYATATSAAIQLQVGGTAGAAAISSFATGGGQAVDTLGEDILPVRTGGTPSSPLSGVWAWLLLLPGVGLLASELVSSLRARQRPTEEKLPDFAAMPTEPDAQLAFLDTLFRAVVARKLGVPAPGLRREDLAGLGSQAAEAEAIYRELEQARYGGGGALPVARLRAFVEALR